MVNTRSHSRKASPFRAPEPLIKDNPFQATVEDEPISAVSPASNNRRVRLGLPKNAPDWTRLSEILRQGSSKGYRSSQLPKPMTKEVTSDEETLSDNESEHNDPRVALPPQRRRIWNPRKPGWCGGFSTARNRAATWKTEREQPDVLVDRNSIERASMSLAHQMLAKEHDRQIGKLGEQIYDSVMKAPTINDAIFDSDSEGSDYTVEADSNSNEPLSPGMLQHQLITRWAYDLRPFLVVSAAVCFVAILVVNEFSQTDQSWFPIVVGTSLILAVLISASIASCVVPVRAQWRRARKGKALRSGNFYIRRE